MCGRFTLTVRQLETVARALHADLASSDAESYRPRYNVAPGDAHWIVRLSAGKRELVPASWGLVNHWAPDPSRAFKQINARAESLATRRAFREALAQRRCVVPADGFYEWYGPQGARRPIWFHAPERALLCFAGLYEHWTNPTTGEVRTTFTIVTTQPNALVAAVHDRMPALIAPGDVESWLAAGPKKLLRRPADDALLATPVSRRVNAAANDDPSVLEPDREQDAGRQLRLF